MKVIFKSDFDLLNRENLINVNQNILVNKNDCIKIGYKDNCEKASLLIGFGYPVSIYGTGQWEYGKIIIDYLGYIKVFDDENRDSRDYYFSNFYRGIKYIKENEKENCGLKVYISESTLKDKDKVNEFEKEGVNLNNDNSIINDVNDKIFRYFGFKLNANKIIVRRY